MCFKVDRKEYLKFTLYVLYCLFLSTCVLQSVCVHTMDFVSAHKQKIKLYYCFFLYCNKIKMLQHVLLLTWPVLELFNALLAKTGDLIFMKQFTQRFPAKVWRRQGSQNIQWVVGGLAWHLRNYDGQFEVDCAVHVFLSSCSPSVGFPALLKCWQRSTAKSYEEQHRLSLPHPLSLVQCRLAVKTLWTAHS